MRIDKFIQQQIMINVVASRDDLPLVTRLCRHKTHIWLLNICTHMNISLLTKLVWTLHSITELSVCHVF